MTTQQTHRMTIPADERCNVCHGTAVILGIRGYDDRVASMNTKRYPCPTCDGTGRRSADA